MSAAQSFSYLCRVCAANTNKDCTIPECVYILRTPGLKEKLKQYLYLEILEDDELPKVLCKTCFRQVEATASLSKIANHTQTVFKDFLFSSLPMFCSENNAKEPETPEFTSITSNAMSMENERARVPLETQPVAPRPEARPVVTPTAPVFSPTVVPTTDSHAHRDELVVNVSVNDPLTRETQQKMISASQKAQTHLDLRFTPKSIAQRAFTSTPKQTESSVSSVGKKKASPPAIINFYHNNPQQTTTFTSGGYVIGNMDHNGVIASAENNSPKPTNAVQPRRKNVKHSSKTSINSGQVSLLKKSQKQVPSTESRSQQVEATTILLRDDDVEDVLPAEIIIASTKKRKHTEPPNISSAKRKPEPNDAAIQTAPREEAPKQHRRKHTDTGPEDIILGNIIRDTDLLKLLLKALKWPVTPQNESLQMTRLRNSKFTAIMSDEKVLQDSDLMQIMGHSVQSFQRLQIAAAAAAINELQGLNIAGSIPYKLPPETSVQLVPASPEEEDNALFCMAEPLPRHAMEQLPKKTRKNKHRPRERTIVISEDDDAMAKAGICIGVHSSSKSAPSFQVDIGSYQPLQGLSTEASNDALRALLNRQRARINRSELKKQNASLASNVPVDDEDSDFDTDDIVLMEPNGGIVPVPIPEPVMNFPKKSPKFSATVAPVPEPDMKLLKSSSSSSDGYNLAHLSNFTAPIITRPIVKRRKTVIQASPACTNISISAIKPHTITRPPKASTPATSSTQTTMITSSTSTSTLEHSKVDESSSTSSMYMTSSSMATQYPSEEMVKADKSTSAIKLNSTTTSVTSFTSSSVSSSSIKSTSKRIHGSKAALGQQLLEAIGLQKVENEHHVDGNKREPVKQIQMALKRSVREAQEQKRKQAEPIIQVADSTTRVSTREAGSSCTSFTPQKSATILDVEEQIDKITLKVNSIMALKKEKKVKKESQSKIPDMRRRSITGRGTKSSLLLLDRDSKPLNTIKEEESTTKLSTKDATKTENIQQGETQQNSREKMLLSPRQTVSDISLLANSRRRGRKTLAEKLAEMESTKINLTRKDSTETKESKPSERTRSPLPGDSNDEKRIESPVPQRSLTNEHSNEIEQVESKGTESPPPPPPERDEKSDYVSKHSKKAQRIRSPLRLARMRSPGREKLAEIRKIEQLRSPTREKEREAAERERAERHMCSPTRYDSSPMRGSSRQRSLSVSSARLSTHANNEDEDAASVKNENVSNKTSVASTSRPARTSKTMSKYYKGPEKPDFSRRTSPWARSTRSSYKN